MSTKKEKRKDLYTVSSYAKMKGLTTAAIYKMIKEERVNIVEINGGLLLKL